MIINGSINIEQYDFKASSLNDYKFFCFNGRPKCCQVIGGRDSVMTVDFFDKEWNHLPFHEPKVYPFSQEEVSKPQSFETMWSLAEKLSANQSFLRVDFYDVNGQIYFGELTFFPTSGMGGFNPEAWDYTFGSWIKSPQK